MNDTFAIEDEVFQVNLVRWALKKRLTFADALRRAGRIVAVNYAKHTQPFGLDDGARKQGEAAVARDIRKVYATGSTVYEAMRQQSEGLADAFYYFYSAGKRKTAQQLVEVGPPRIKNLKIAALQPSLHQKVRNRRGRVAGSQSFLQIVTNPAKLESYIKSKQRLVGFVKAGYARIAEVLGGTRGIPQWVTRHKNKVSADVVDATQHSTDPHIILRNHVSYASEAIREADKANALRDGRDNMVAYLRKQLGKDDFSESTVYNPSY